MHANERLYVYSNLRISEGKVISKNFANLLVGQLMQIGFGKSPRNKNVTHYSIKPIGYYEPNINGGNPAKPLILGGLSFVGDRNLYKKSGLIGGAGLGLNGRYNFGGGQYLDYASSISYAHSPEYKIGVASYKINSCSINHIKNWWYIDGCIRNTRINKKITSIINNNVSLTASRFFEMPAQKYGNLKLGINRLYSGAYSQNQLKLSMDTINKTGIFTSFDATFGEDIKNELTTQSAVRILMKINFYDKPLSLVTSYDFRKGGVMIGNSVNEKTLLFSLSYPIGRGFQGNIGYKKTDSTIDYFDLATPSLGIEFPEIKF